jgi:ATP-binding cassette subfamily F protein 3
VEWLEGFLRSYSGAIVVISHDRFFLDQVTQRTLELENCRLDSYNDNYTGYVKLKEERMLSQLKAYEKQQKVIEATEQYINKYRAGIKSKQARGRQSQLNRLERIDKPQENSTIQLGEDPYQVRQSANTVLKVTDLALSFDNKKVCEKVAFTLNRGEKVSLIGPNGIGKTTILNTIKGQVEPKEGTITLGVRVNIGWFDQEHRDLTETNQVLDEIINDMEITVAEARNMLGSFLFRGDDVFKRVEDLSGGEKGRLAFLKLIMRKPNFFVLDEPTNHLDIASKGVIEEYLEGYPGTILVVSHDRYFLDKITKRTLELTPQGVIDYLGNYSYYREKKVQLEKEKEIASETKVVAKGVKVEKVKINKAQTREKIRQLETKIEEMETRKEDLTNLLADAATYQNEEIAKKLLGEYKELEEKIPKCYSEWDELLTLLGD